MSHPPVGHAARFAASAVKDLAPLHERKNPFLAFGLGFLFGPFGVAIYFRSPKDFFICLAILIAFSLLLGVGAIVGWLFSAVYGAYRAHTSNEKLEVL